MKIIILEDKSIDKSNLVGGTIIGLRNIDLMRDIFGVCNVEMLQYKLPNVRRYVGRLSRKLFFFNAGMSFITAFKISRQIHQIKPDAVFINTALNGILIKIIKTKSPEIKIYTFFHNVEYDFFRDLTKTTKKFIGGFIRSLVFNNERKSVLLSDVLITLNERDSRRLYELYGRSADLVLPSSFKDCYKQVEVKTDPTTTRLLFVGYNFYANLDGIGWFVDNVMPYLGRNYTLYIVGRNMENEKNRLSRNNVEVIGTVDDLAYWYNYCDIVVLPIFSGSGMKTKTAEAMMYGKPIIASKESFEGYEIENYSEIGALCETPQEFIEKIKTLGDKTKKGQNARSLFLEKYNYNVVLDKAKKFFLNGKN